MNNKKKYFRILSFAFTLLMLFQCIVCIGVSAEDGEDEIQPQEVELREMVCRIKNASTGLYLDSYKYTAKTKGKSYLETYSKDSLGQVFHLSPCEDGTYMIIPQNDSGNYVYSYDSDINKKPFLQKIKLSSAGDMSKFDIIKFVNGTFVIAPINTKNEKAVLTQSETKTEYKDFYTEISELTNDAKNQTWIIEPIKTEKLSVIYTTTKVRLYGTGKFYARKYPYNVFTEDIKWTSNDENVIMIGSDGTWCALGIGEATITASAEGVSKSFKVTVVDRDAFTWYSQNNIYTSDWDATQLLSLKFRSNDGYTKKFAVDSKEPGGNNCWMDQGCGNSAVAMVLNNMGAVKTNGYDFRSGQEGNLIADPYTVALANSGQYGPDTASTTLRGNPIWMAWAYVAEQFNVDGKTVKSNKLYYPTRTKIKNLLADHPEGVVVQVEKGSKNHYLVFAECINPQEKVNSKLNFMVSDSAAYLPVNGDFVPFEKSTSYLYEGYRYGNIVSVLYFTLEDNKEN
jgi:hypothetical protein